MARKRIAPKLSLEDNVGEILVSGGGRAQLKVAVETGLFQTLLDNQEAFRAVIEQFGDTVKQSAARGDFSGFSVVVDPAGGSTIRALENVSSAVSTQSGRPALAAARARGQIAAATILGHSDMLSAAQLGGMLDVSRMTINTRRAKREILGLDSAKRGYRFPVWQFDDRGRAFPELRQLFVLLGDEPWAVYRFLVQRHAVLGGVSARDALRAGRGIEVLAAAAALQAGAFA